MNIGQIYRRSLDIALGSRPLWLLGVAVVALTGSSAFGSLQSVSGALNGDKKIPLLLDRAFHSIPVSVWVILAVSLLLAAVTTALFALIAGNWAKGALIGAINEADDNREVTLKSGADWGIRGLKSLILLNLVPWFVYAIAFAAAFGLSALLFVLLTPLGIAFGIIFGFVLVLAAFAITGSLIFAERIAVLDGAGFKEALTKGWQIFKKNIVDMIVLGIANKISGCCVGCLGLAVMLLLIAPLAAFLAAGSGLFLLNPSAGLLFGAGAITFVVPPLLLLGVLLGGIYTVFNYTTWNIFLKELRSKKTDE